LDFSSWRFIDGFRWSADGPAEEEGGEKIPCGELPISGLADGYVFGRGIRSNRSDCWEWERQDAVNPGRFSLGFQERIIERIEEVNQHFEEWAFSPPESRHGRSARNSAA
jgi:hypothetical protein